MNYIGSDDSEAGKAGGGFFGEQGVKKVLCVNTLPGAANSEARCDGIAEGIKSSGGTSKQLPLPSSNFGNPTAIAQAVKAALLKDDSDRRGRDHQHRRRRRGRQAASTRPASVTR